MMPASRFYAHLALLHGGLLLRIVGGDLLGSETAWQAGGVLNVTALLLFVGSSAIALAHGRELMPTKASDPLPQSNGGGTIVTDRVVPGGVAMGPDLTLAAHAFQGDDARRDARGRDAVGGC